MPDNTPPNPGTGSPNPGSTPPAPNGDSGSKLYPAEPAAPGAGSDAPKPGDQPSDKKNSDESNKGTDGKARVVPEKYELKLPDGSPLNAKALDQVASFAKEKGLTQDEAQAILERESAVLASYVDSQKQELAQKQKEWVESIKTDKEIGGDGFNKTIEMAKRVVDRFATDSLKKALNDSGLGNHPELVRFVARIGKAMSEDQLILPSAQTGGKKSMEDVFYPASKS